MCAARVFVIKWLICVWTKETPKSNLNRPHRVVTSSFACVMWFSTWYIYIYREFYLYLYFVVCKFVINHPSTLSLSPALYLSLALYLRATSILFATHQPGEDYKQFRIGQTSTVFGTVNMAVAYRTKMTISPTQTSRDASSKIMLKSDHFLHDHHHHISPKPNRYYIARNK